VVRQWAELEGKSPAMSEDLLRNREPRRGRKLLFAVLNSIAHVGDSLAELWRMFRSG
jgi:hypothetical protein